MSLSDRALEESYQDIKLRDYKVSGAACSFGLLPPNSHPGNVAIIRKHSPSCLRDRRFQLNVLGIFNENINGPYKAPADEVRMPQVLSGRQGAI